MTSSTTTGTTNPGPARELRAAGQSRRTSASLVRTAELARRLALIDDETALASALADATRRVAPIARAWILLLHESSGELAESVRLPEESQGERIVVGVEALAKLELPMAHAGVVLRGGEALAAALVPGVHDPKIALFAPHGRDPEPTLVLVATPEGGARLRSAERAALQACVDAAGHALERRRLVARVELYKNDAERDFLTGIFNRRLTMRLLEREIRKSHRTQSPLSLVMIDLDNFKSFNDAYGHLAGDEVLRTLASLFAATGRATDVVGRFGGEEFLVILPDTSVEHAVIFAERVRQDVEIFGHDHLKNFRNHPPTISVGVCSVGPRDTTDAAIARADRALYQSKQRGRNCFSLGLPEEDRA